MRTLLRCTVFVALIMAAAGISIGEGLPPGEHSAHPKYWRVLNRSVTNYTPLELNYRIENLTVALDGALWFSVGSSIQRIDMSGRITQNVMPYDLWRVSGITQVGSNIWFSAGQSGKVGKIDAQGELTFLQIVPRRYFPDIRDLVVNREGEMWFVDLGRRSIGHRSTSGRVVEHPMPGGAQPGRMQQCMGRLWVVADTPATSRLAVINSNFYAQWYPSSELPQRAIISGISCDSANNLWLTLNDRYRSPTAHAARVAPDGSVKLFQFPSSWAGDVACGGSEDAWISVSISDAYAQGLVHIDKNGLVHTYAFPSQSSSPGSIAVGLDGSIWLSIENGNSPLSIAHLQRI